MKEAVCIMTMINHFFLPIMIKRTAQKLPPLKLFQKSCNESSWLVKATAAINRCQTPALLSKTLRNMNFLSLTFSSVYFMQAENAWLGQKYKPKKTAVYICAYAFEPIRRVNLNLFSELNPHF